MSLIPIVDGGEPKKGRAGEGTRTLDINLGKVALYQLSYTRERLNIYAQPGGGVKAAS